MNGDNHERGTFQRRGRINIKESQDSSNDPHCTQEIWLLYKWKKERGPWLSVFPYTRHCTKCWRFREKRPSSWPLMLRLEWDNRQVSVQCDSCSAKTGHRKLPSLARTNQEEKKKLQGADKSQEPRWGSWHIQAVIYIYICCGWGIRCGLCTNLARKTSCVLEVFKQVFIL